MKIRKLLAITLICVAFSASAYGQGEIVSKAYELALSNFRAPTTTNSGVAFKQCDDCKQQRVRVTGATSYSINGKHVRLEDFRKAVTQADDRDEKTVIVLHHLESDTVVSINVSI